MKIKISQEQLNELITLKENIKKLLEFYSDNLEATDENLIKIKELSNKINGILPPNLKYKFVNIKMVNSAGTKFTIE